MKIRLFLAAILVSIILPAKAETFEEISQFAQSICGDIPSGKLTRTEIQAKVKADVGLLAKIFSGSVELSPSKQEEIYIGIPFDKLPNNIPTVSMCKSELVKVLLARKKISANTCRHPDFGQEGWKKTETYSDSSGRLGGGHDQNWWCNQVVSSFLQSRVIGPQNHVEQQQGLEGRRYL